MNMESISGNECGDYLGKTPTVPPLVEAKETLGESHAEIIALIGRFADEELFEKKHFPWTGTTSLGSYCISATSSHYDWAIKKNKRQIKESRP